jgi:AcrR family transcriptional regulator
VKKIMARSLSPEKRAKLLTAALKLFVKNGVTNTSTSEIAKEAGIAAGTLFLYFSKKQELLDQLVLKIGKEQSEQINQLLEPTLSVRETFFTIWYGTVTWFLGNLDAFQYLQQVRDTGLISDAAVQESGRFFGYYYDAIQKGLAEGSLKPYPLGLIGDFLYQDIVAVINHLSRQPDPSQREEIIRQGFEIFWNGIKAAENADPGKG